MTRDDARLFMRKLWREAVKDSFAEEAFEIAIKALEQPEQRWIPVSERLPEENKIVLITFDERVEMGRMRGESWEWLFESGWNYWVDIDNVTAWMPLPKPYGGDE